MKRAKLKTIAYWVTTILGPASFAYGGIIHLLRREDVVGTLAHLGYPAYFATILGVGKLLGAIAVVVPRFPRLKEWAYAGFFIDLTAAAASRAFAKDGVGDTIAPLVFLALVMASWALRPDSRKLASAPAPAPRVNKVADKLGSTGSTGAAPGNALSMQTVEPVARATR